MDFNKHYFIESTLPEFIMLIGIPGAGKTRWVNQFNADNKYRVVRPDDIRKELTRSISDQSQNAQVWPTAKERVVNALKKGKSVILDSTMTDPARRKDFIKDLPPAQLKAKVFYVDPKISKERIHKDLEAKKERSDVPDAIVDKMYLELMTKVKLLDGGVLDLSQLEEEGFEIIK